MLATSSTPTHQEEFLGFLVKILKKINAAISKMC
jgi:hypothetical protein